VGVILAVSLVGQAKEGNVVGAQQPSSGSPQQAVDTRVAEWVESLNNESVSGLVRFYTNNASLSWDGLTGFGTFAGQSNVRLLYTALFANATRLSAIPSPVNTSSLTPTMVSAKFELHLNAQKGAAGLIGFIIYV